MYLKKWKGYRTPRPCIWSQWCGSTSSISDEVVPVPKPSGTHLEKSSLVPKAPEDLYRSFPLLLRTVLWRSCRYSLCAVSHLHIVVVIQICSRITPLDFPRALRTLYSQSLCASVPCCIRTFARSLISAHNLTDGRQFNHCPLEGSGRAMRV